MIEVRNLWKIYRTYEKEEGLIGSLKALFKRKYRDVEALKGVSFTIEEGEFVGYIGPNGAGKTTTLKILSGILYPTKGEAKVLGFIPWERKAEFLKQISFVMGQKHQLWWDLPALESFLLNKEIYEIPSHLFYANLEELSSLLAVEDLLKVPVRNLSLGERMKMELIASLLHSPRVLFLDEPTIGLDVVAQKEIRDFLKRFNKEHKTTIMLTSHYVRDIEALCERVLVLHRGEIIFEGSIKELTRRYSDDKLLTITFEERVPDEIESYGRLLSRDEGKATLRVGRDKVADVARALLESYSVKDIVVEEIPIEDVIREIFLSLGREEDGEI
ncbi:ABC transporter ATP-binding protein [bacterium]|nr:ABC transporter ATP-binding protein [bacterium]